MYQANLLTLKSQEDIDEYLESELREVDRQEENNFDKTVVSDAYAAAADIAISAAPLGDSDATRAEELGNIADRLSTIALELLEETDGAEVEESSADVQINSLLSQDISLRSGQAQLLLGNVEKAAFLFNDIRQEVHENRLYTYLSSILGLIRALVGKVGGLEKTRSLVNKKPAKTPRGRKTRTTPKNDSTIDVEKNLRIVEGGRAMSARILLGTANSHGSFLDARFHSGTCERVYRSCMGNRQWIFSSMASS